MKKLSNTTSKNSDAHNLSERTKSNGIDSNAKISSLKKFEIISKSKRPTIHHQFLILFFFLKLVIFSLAHISVALIRPNNRASDLIIYSSNDLNNFDRFVKGFVTPFMRWDGVHMLAIAKHGYVFENQFAFFPLLPLGARYIALILLELCGFKSIISFEPLVGLVAIVFTNLCHYFATIYLFKLSLLLFKSTKFAKTSALMFLFNPAIIQLSAFYTESPFALFTFIGLYQFYQGKMFLASLLWALASITRSNGIVLAGFFFYNFLTSIFSTSKATSFVSITYKLLKTLTLSVISVSGFVAFQIFGYDQFCLIDNPTRPWCFYSIPSIYTFVQKEYWNVGLFKYFTFNQIPNFLFALPMIIICSSAAFLYFESDHFRFLSLGLNRIKNRPNRSLKLFYDDQVLPHIYLLLFMLFYNVFVAHVQIITRVFTFLPVVYWFMALLIMISGLRTKKLLLTYIGLYGMIGTVLFTLNYPPA